MFYIIGKNDIKNTFTILDTEDMSTEEVNKDDALDFFKTTGIEYRIMLNSSMISCKDYCILYIQSEDLIKGVLLKCGRYTKAVGFQKECSDISLSVEDNVKIIYHVKLFGTDLYSTSTYTKVLDLLEEGSWKRG